MAYGVAEIESVVRSRLGGILTQVHKITEDTDKPNIQEAIAWAGRKLGYTIAKLDAVTDAELELIADTDIDVLIDLSELATLRALPGNLPGIDTQTGPMRVTVSKLAEQLENMIGRRTGEIITEHGNRVPGLQIGEYRRARIVAV